MQAMINTIWSTFTTLSMSLAREGAVDHTGHTRKSDQHPVADVAFS
jgi:hypothetical protein